MRTWDDTRPPSYLIHESTSDDVFGTDNGEVVAVERVMTVAGITAVGHPRGAARFEALNSLVSYLTDHCCQGRPELCAASDRLILTLVSIEYDNHRSLQRAVDRTAIGAMTRCSIYIDIDGVCLRHASAYSSRTGVELAPHAFQFLRWAADAHIPHWLTTRDAHGSHDGAIRAFKLALDSPALDSEIGELLRTIKPTTWSGSKIAGIDLKADFVWIDDQPLTVEIDALHELNLSHRLLVINTNNDHDALLHAMEFINSL